MTNSATPPPAPSRDIGRLIEIMAALRTPGTGCAWDLAQDFASIAPYTIEEAYEVADAIARGDFVDLVDELGDLLLQVAFHARMAEEAGRFAFGDVVYAITAKMIRRHPHVFGTVSSRDPEAIKRLWGEIKAQEKAERAARHAAAGLPAAPASALDGVPVALPGLTRAVKLQDRAAAVGFDWGAVGPVIAKIREELAEVEDEIARGDKAAAAGEIGDLLFAVGNLARHLDVDAEAALRGTNEKFVRRFGAVERALAARGLTPSQSTLDEMDALWDAAKAAEQSSKP